MRPYWRGHISFGLVTFPVKVYTATEEKDVRFRLLHRECDVPGAMHRACGEESPRWQATETESSPWTRSG